MPSRLPLPDLVDLCRALRHNLGAGLSLVRVMKQQAERGRPAVRPVAARLSERLQTGSGLGDALDAEGGTFPPLFLALARVGEETGNLPDIFGELEQYYQLEWQLRKQFISQSILPVLQFVFAVFLIAGLIWLLYAISGQPMLTFFGLAGAKGSLAFLAVVGAAIGTLVMLYVALTRLTPQQAAAERVFFNAPILGPCLQAMAQYRFALALALTLDSGLSIIKALRLSLRATGFAWFADRADVVALALKNGRSLTEALEASGLFGPELISIVETGEEGGRVPEVMRHQAGFYREEVSRRLTTLTWAAGGLVWLASAGFIIWMIFRLAGVYLNALKI